MVYKPAQPFSSCENRSVDHVGRIPAGLPVTSLFTLEYMSNALLATKTLSLADLPCPPSAIAKIYSPGVPYLPILSPDYLWDAPVRNKTCHHICGEPTVTPKPKAATHALPVKRPSRRKHRGGKIPLHRGVRWETTSTSYGSKTKTQLLTGSTLQASHCSPSGSGSYSKKPHQQPTKPC